MGARSCAQAEFGLLRTYRGTCARYVIHTTYVRLLQCVRLTCAAPLLTGEAHIGKRFLTHMHMLLRFCRLFSRSPGTATMVSRSLTVVYTRLRRRCLRAGTMRRVVAIHVTRPAGLCRCMRSICPTLMSCMRSICPSLSCMNHVQIAIVMVLGEVSARLWVSIAKSMC